MQVIDKLFAKVSELFVKYHNDDDLMIICDVKVIDKKTGRSIAQNSLYWLWLTEIEKHTGDNRYIEHIRAKRKHLSKIFMRDKDGFMDLVQSLNVAENLMDDREYENLAMGVANEMSTTKMDTKQMSEYLDLIERHWLVNHGLSLPQPADLIWSK